MGIFVSKSGRGESQRRPHGNTTTGLQKSSNTGDPGSSNAVGTRTMNKGNVNESDRVSVNKVENCDENRKDGERSKQRDNNDDNKEQSKMASTAGPVSSAHGATTTTTEGQSYTVASHDSGGNEESDIYSNIWYAIDAGLEEWNAFNRKRQVPSHKDWTVIRLFVSSTFTDFYAEREVLVKRVMPTINDWCAQRKIQVIECDLRWGIPKNTSANDTIQICMEEIDKCLADTGGQAFFLNMLGERYGWIPDLRQIDSETVRQFDLIQGISITHAEILQAALRSSSQNAIFFMRNSSFISELPEGMKPSFVEATWAGKQKLTELKNQLKRRFPEQVFEYDCNYNCIGSESGLADSSIKRLESFADTAIDFFKNAIEKFCPNQEKVLSDEELYFLYQDGFIDKKCALLVGRDSEVRKIVDFAQDFVESSSSHGNYCFVTGTSGIGKSSLLAHVVRSLKSAGLNCLYNFASASPGSTVSSFVTDVFTKTLMSSQGQSVKDFDSQSLEFRKSKYKEMVKDILFEERQITFVFDAVNQFSDLEAFSLDWLPFELKGRAKCIVGCTDDSQIIDMLKDKVSSIPYEEIQLKGFDQQSSEEFITSAFARYSKKLDDVQMRQLIGKNESFSPLWLSLACEELRIFGIFEQLNDRILSLPGQLEELVFNIVKRLIDEDETDLIKDIVCHLVCSTSGLTETELRWSCGDGKEPVSIFLWKKCQLLLKPYLLIVGKRRGEENLAFCHDSFNIAVKKNLLSDEVLKRSYHSKLATSFAAHCNDDIRLASELPIQLKLAKDFIALVEFFRKDIRSLRVSYIHKSQHLRELRCISFVDGANVRFSAPVYLCNMCSTKTKAFTPAPGLNKDSCLICGANVPFKNNSLLAYVCMKHKNNTAPETAKCWVCKSVIFLKLKMNFNQMYTCQFCASQGQKCVKLNT
ncbi:telomerase protein component 1-like [Rhopilema esculentum]|uniref:telomerase protein component 1-like n=1 Tax=Rhopilema esculentum TaxID=499914 RepID=UPI0031D69F07|eukprot:gene9579-17334_t